MVPVGKPVVQVTTVIYTSGFDEVIYLVSNVYVSKSPIDDFAGEVFRKKSSSRHERDITGFFRVVGKGIPVRLNGLGPGVQVWVVKDH